jgi:hypothetical protein
MWQEDRVAYTGVSFHLLPPLQTCEVISHELGRNGFSDASHEVSLSINHVQYFGRIGTRCGSTGQGVSVDI